MCLFKVESLVCICFCLIFKNGLQKNEILSNLNKFRLYYYCKRNALMPPNTLPWCEYILWHIYDYVEDLLWIFPYDTKQKLFLRLQSCINSSLEDADYKFPTDVCRCLITIVCPNAQLSFQTD